MFGAILGGLGSLASGLFGGGKKESSPVSGLGESMMQGLGTSVGGGLGSAASSALFPSPSPGTQGSDLRSFMDSAYPGTTPWERLGAGGAASGFTSAQASIKNQSTAVNSQAALNAAQIDMQREALKEQARVNSATIGYTGARTDTEVERLAQARYDAIASGHKAEIEKANAKYAEAQARANAAPKTGTHASINIVGQAGRELIDRVVESRAKSKKDEFDKHLKDWESSRLPKVKFKQTLP